MMRIDQLIRRFCNFSHIKGDSFLLSLRNMKQADETIKQLLDKNFPMLDEPVKNIISEEASLLEVNKGQLMTRTGNNLRHVVLVADGYMKVYREGEDGDIFLYYLQGGSACAMSLVCASKQETSEVMITALEDSRVILLPIAVMEILMQGHKNWYQFVVDTYRSRFEELLSAFDSVVFKKLDERLLEYLNGHAHRLGSRVLHITHQQIADDMHSTREVISRLLKSMEQKNMLTIGRNSISLKTDIALA
jgi:CRP/FNR family transcriptional regulator